MRGVFASRPTLVWCVLLGATALSWAAARIGGRMSHRFATGSVIVIALFKARLVLLEFMELRHAPRPMRLACEGWAVSLGIVLAFLL